MRIGNRTKAFERYRFQWPWTTLSDVAKFFYDTARLSATADELLVRKENKYVFFFGRVHILIKVVRQEKSYSAKK